VGVAGGWATGRGVSICKTEAHRASPGAPEFCYFLTR
jgi:hypothetical protein